MITVQASKFDPLDLSSLQKETYLIKIKNNVSETAFKNKYSSIISVDSRSESGVTKSEDKWIKASLKTKDISQLLSDKSVVTIQKDVRRTVKTTPNDTHYQYQWNMGKIYMDDSHTSQSAWSTTTGSASTIVAVIDTGIDLTHPDLTANLWTNTSEIANNGIDDDGNGYIDDVTGWNFADKNNNVQDTSGHGTHVSGIIAAVTNNSVGVAGTCWTCKIMPLKVINTQGFGYDSDIALAIRYATDKGANVINMSLGGAGYSQVLQDAVTYAWTHNVVVVSASGNDGASASDSYPGGLQDSLSVGATDINDAVGSFSNTGGKLDLTAPGVNIISTKLQTAANDCLGSDIYACLTGTSMASPHVAGVAALLHTLHTGWTPAQIRYAILKNIDDKGSAGFDNSFGFGRLNAYKALQQTTPPTDITVPVSQLSISNGAVIGGSSYAIPGTATDADLYEYTVSILRSSDNYIVKQLSGRSNVSSGTLVQFNTTSFSDGSYKLLLTTEDFAGNITNSSLISVIIDNTSPSTFNLVSPLNDVVLNLTAPSFSWTASTDPHNVSYNLYVDGSLAASNLSTTSYVSPVNYSQGHHNWYVVSFDDVGNSYTSSTGSFYIDTIAPNYFDVNVTVTGSTADLIFSTTDNVSGISKYELAIDTGEYFAVTSPYKITSLPDGSHSVTVRAIDGGGRYTTSTTNFTIDTRTPYLQSKADFTHNGKVDLSDLSILASNWNKNTSVGDANNDGKVNLSDLSILASNWNKSF